MASPLCACRTARRRLSSARLAALCFALGAGALPAPAVAQDRILGQGGWSWFADPRALYYAGRQYAGWADRRGRVNVGQYNNGSARTVAVALFDHVDDHDNPSLSLRPDGRLMVFFSHHAEDQIHYRVSSRPLDITAWGPERSVPTRRVGKWGNTYPNPIRLPAEGNRLLLFWRGSDWSTFFSTQRPGGGWSQPRRVIRVPHLRPYVKYARSGGGTIHMAFTRSHPREGGTGVYYAKYRHGAFFRASGRRIRSVRRLPFRPREADKVYDARRYGANGWVWDIAIGRRGRPVIVYAVVHSRRRHSYRYARWTGRRWEDRFMARAGGTISTTPREWAYSGGITLDKRDPSVAYLSRKIGAVNEVERWRTRNGGRTWSYRALTRDRTSGAYRPVVPFGLPLGHPEELLWLQGQYGTYRTFHTWVELHSEAPSPPAVLAATGGRPAHAGSTEVALRASVIEAGPSPPISLEWQFGDGQSAYGPAVRHAYARPGDYFPRLVARDAAGGESVYVRELRVGP
jgi:hypothetical protein